MWAVYIVFINLVKTEAWCCNVQASDDKKNQKEIGDIAGVADVTIRQSYKLMYPHATQLFPEDFKFATPIELLPQM